MPNTNRYLRAKQILQRLEPRFADCAPVGDDYDLLAGIVRLCRDIVDEFEIGRKLKRATAGLENNAGRERLKEAV